MTEVCIGIGSNVEKERNIPDAMERLRALLESVRFSSIYETEPEGMEGAESFWNLAARSRTPLPLADLRERLYAIEEELGRRRDSADRFTPRTIDLDPLLFGHEIDTGHPSGPPHPLILTAPFVLFPLGEIAAEWVHPLDGRTIGEIRAAFRGPTGVIRVIPIGNLGPETAEGREPGRRPDGPTVRPR